MLDKVKELINRPHCYTITFKYESYGPMIVTCTVKRPYIKHLAVQSVNSNEESALCSALKLLDKVKELETDEIIECPPLNKQTSINGYYRENNIEKEIEFKRTENSYVITNVRIKKDKQGFYSVDPFPINEDFFKANNLNIALEEGEELYEWDQIGYLCGSSGLVIVKDGMIIKQKTLMIA